METTAPLEEAQPWLDACAAFITTEFTTIDRDGRPVTWPVTPYGGDAGVFELTTGIGYPKKARDAQRTPEVSLLFSDPTGAGVDEPAMVLVQGRAEVDDRDLAANARRYLDQLSVKLPAAAKSLPPAFVREGVMLWYFGRIYVRVHPHRVLVWPHADLGAQPLVFGAALPAAAPAPADDVRSSWHSRIDELGAGALRSAVVSWIGADGYPLALRVPVTPDRDAGVVRIDAGAAAALLRPVRACLVAHTHDADFTWQSNFQVRGALAEADGAWRLVPERVVGGFELPKSRLRMLAAMVARTRRHRRTALAEIAARKAA